MHVLKRRNVVLDSSDDEAKEVPLDLMQASSRNRTAWPHPSLESEDEREWNYQERPDEAEPTSARSWEGKGDWKIVEQKLDDDAEVQYLVKDVSALPPSTQLQVWVSRSDLELRKPALIEAYDRGLQRENLRATPMTTRSTPKRSAAKNAASRLQQLAQTTCMSTEAHSQSNISQEGCEDEEKEQEDGDYGEASGNGSVLQTPTREPQVEKENGGSGRTTRRSSTRVQRLKQQEQRERVSRLQILRSMRELEGFDKERTARGTRGLQR
jgi:hypothetical protein